MRAGVRGRQKRVTYLSEDVVQQGVVCVVVHLEGSGEGGQGVGAGTTERSLLDRGSRRVRGRARCGPPLIIRLHSCGLRTVSKKKQGHRQVGGWTVACRIRAVGQADQAISVERFVLGKEGGRRRMFLGLSNEKGSETRTPAGRTQDGEDQGRHQAVHRECTSSLAPVVAVDALAASPAPILGLEGR